MSEYLGLIGYPLKHSISRYFQQVALDYYGLDIQYENWETPPAELPDMVSNLRKPRSLGANVTVPYKEEVLPLLDAVDDMAGSIGAVNTIIRKEDKLTGANTDAYGFLEALDRERHFDPRGKQVIMLGAGALYIGHLVRKSEKEWDVFHRRFFGDDLRGWCVQNNLGFGRRGREF